jgi:prepilin-type N-terminal cleavage/methylation domain-containing protein
MVLAARVRESRGFTLVDTMVTIAVFSILMAMAVPGVIDATDAFRLGTATRVVERELQTARLKAVTANRSMRVRLNCPSAGQFRMVEVMNSAGVDSASNRCSESVYAYPSPRDTDVTTPAHDGPVGRVHDTVTLPTVVFQFAPDGRTTKVVSGTPTAFTTETVTLTKGTRTQSITINALGKIQLQ